MARIVQKYGGTSVSTIDRIKCVAGIIEETRRQIFENLSPWQRVQLARHPLRPYTLDYIGMMMTDFVELHGDRAFADDAAVLGGIGRFQGRSVVVLVRG